MSSEMTPKTREELITANARFGEYVRKAESARVTPAPRYDLSAEESLAASHRFRESMAKRRTIRSYSTESVAWELIENAVAVAGRAPSGAN